jgi:predicted phage tail protein
VIDRPITPGVVSASPKSPPVNFTATDDSGAAPTCDRVSGATYPLNVGLNVVSVTCTDGGGFSATDSVVFARATAIAIPTITAPAKKSIKSSKLKTLSGTAAANTSVTKVEIALQRSDSKLLKSKKQCLWLKNKSKFAKVKAVKKKCSTPKWLVAKGTANWSYRVSKLSKGSYVLSVRATPAGGDAGRTAVKKFKVT